MSLALRSVLHLLDDLETPILSAWRLLLHQLWRLQLVQRGRSKIVKVKEFNKALQKNFIFWLTRNLLDVNVLIKPAIERCVMTFDCSCLS